MNSLITTQVLATFLFSLMLQEQAQLEQYLNRALEGDSSSYYFSKAKQLATSPTEEGTFHYYALLYLYDNANTDSAEWHAQKSLDLFRSSGEKTSLRKVYHQLLLINRDKGLLDKSLEYCLAAYRLAVDLKDTAQIARYLTERAFIHHDFEQYALGIASGKEALKVWEAHSEAIDMHKVYILNAIAINFDDWNKPDSALAYYSRILSIKSMKGSAVLGPIYNNQGNTLMKQGRYREAYESLRTSFEIEQKGSGDYHHYDLATVLNNLGMIQIHFNNWDSARYFLDMAQVFADSSGSFEKKRDVYFSQYQLAEKTSKLPKAIDYQNKYYAIKDSIFKKDRAAIIARMEAEYETEKKEQQIALQQADLAKQQAQLSFDRLLLIGISTVLILLLVVGLLYRSRMAKKQELAIQEEKLRSQQRAIEATISSQEKERARYARDLHDGFGQMISTLKMNLARLRSDARPDDRHATFNASSEIIDAMYEELRHICFDLMPNTLVQEGLEAALKELCNRLNSTEKIHIELNLFGPEGRLEDIQEISIYRIAQEWINNILKYSNASKITFQLTVDQEEITLLIEDDGAGFDRKRLTESKGHGWKNLNTRSRLIQGILEIESMPGQRGSALILNAPLHLSKSEVEKNTVTRV